MSNTPSLEKNVKYPFITTLFVILFFSILKIYGDYSAISNVDFNTLKTKPIETNIDLNVLKQLR